MTSISEHVRSIRGPLAIFFSLVLGWIAFVIWTHGQLPDRMAVHFDGAGRPDRWSGKGEMTAVMLAMAVLYSLVFGGFAICLPKVPTKLWNLPRKDYWLQPERAARTMTEFARDYLWMGVTMILFMGYVQWDVLQANTVRPDHRLTLNLWLVVALVALITGMAIRMVIKYYRVPEPKT